MLHYFSLSKSPKKFKTLTGFVLGIITVFAAYLLAQAIVPGAMTVPPQDISQDVELRRQLDCQVVAGAPGDYSSADCDSLPSGYKLTGGSGACNSNDAEKPVFIPDYPNNRVTAYCVSSNSEVAYAICCKYL